MSGAPHFGAGGLTWADVEFAAGDFEGTLDAICPICGPDRRAGFNRIRKVLRIWRSERDFASYYCKRCGVRGWVKPDAISVPKPKGGKLVQALDLAERTANRQAIAAAEELERARRAAWAEFTYFSAGAIESTLAEQYLQSRGVTPGADLRFSPIAPLGYGGARTSPGMVAAVRDAAGAIIGCHITYLSGDATKLDRRCYGRVGGGAIRLAEVGVSGHLAVAEGIETARSFTALYGVPCWAGISGGGIEQFQPPAGLSRLIIAADNDAHGRGLEAAQALAKRACEHCEVVISAPAGRGDWNDLLRQVAA